MIYILIYSNPYVACLAASEKKIYVVAAQKREISICFSFYREYGYLFKRIKHISTTQAFSSYLSSLSKFYGMRNESFRACNVRYRKVDPLNEFFFPKISESSLFIVYVDNY